METEGVYVCDEPGCGWKHDGRMRPQRMGNDAVDAHAAGHGKRCRPFAPRMGRLIAVAGLGKRWAIDEFGEWWSWCGGKWTWEPFGQGDNGS